MPRTLTTAVPLALLGACAAELDMGSDAPSAAIEDSAAGTDPTGSPAPTDTDMGLVEPPIWWSLDGSLRLLGEQIEPLYSALDIHLWSADLGLLCTLEVPIEGAMSLTPPETGSELYTWWSIDHGEGTATNDCGVWAAGNLALGLGPHDARLDPALDARDLLDRDLFGLYLQLDPEAPVYVVGIAGTSDLLAGRSNTDVQPLPDDQYQLESLLVLAIEP